ncbi:hypothetical protein LXL04_021869 [Taraxacum kok-saghyz]
MRKICPNIYTIGPLHALHKARLLAKTPPETTLSNSVWKEDVTCLSWLDKQPPKTVVYVSIGSLATMSVDQLIEIWHGLVNSGKPFLWVRHPGSVTDWAPGRCHGPPCYWWISNTVGGTRLSRVL